MRKTGYRIYSTSILMILYIMIFGQNDNALKWNNLLEFRILNESYDNYCLLPENLDSISVSIDIVDSKRILERARPCSGLKLTGRRIGILVFKDGKIKKIQILEFGFVDLSNNGRQYKFTNAKRDEIEEWHTYLLRNSISDKKLKLLEIEDILGKVSSKTYFKGNYIDVYHFKDDFFSFFEFLYYNLTNDEIDRFAKSQNSIYNAAAFLIIVYRNFDGRYTRNKLIQLSKKNLKQIQYEKFSNKNISLSEFCLRVLLQDKDSPLYLLNEKEVNRLKNKILSR